MKNSISRSLSVGLIRCIQILEKSGMPTFSFFFLLAKENKDNDGSMALWVKELNGIPLYSRIWIHRIKPIELNSMAYHLGEHHRCFGFLDAVLL